MVLKKFFGIRKIGEKISLKAKRIIILLILLFVSSFVFSDDSLNFKLTHFVGDPTSDGYFEFWRFGTREMLSNVNLEGGGSHNQFATLGVRYRGLFTISTMLFQCDPKYYKH